MQTLPTYLINIDDVECGMTTISFVDQPAIEVNFLKFDTQKMLFADEDKKVVYGPAILAGVPIYRFSPSMGEYNIVFTKDVIEQIVIKYSKDGLWNKVNLQHNSNKYIDDVVMMQMFIKDSVNGINPKGFEDCPDGSLFVAFKITNDELWKEIKNSKEVNGFSIEIFADLEKQLMNKQEQTIDEYINYLLN